MKLSRIAIAIAALSSALSGCGEAEQPTCEFTLSDHAGDCLALAKPAPSRGFQLHFGPSDYRDPAELQKFLIGPKRETNFCLFMTSPDEDVYFYEFHSTLRPGSHHMVIFGAPAGDSSVPPDGTLESCDVFPGIQYYFIIGAQNGLGPEGGRIDFPKPGAPTPPENAHLGYVIKARTRIAYQLHYVNSGEKPILQESWTNVMYMPKEQVEQTAVPLWWIGGLQMLFFPVAPNSTAIVKNRCNNPIELGQTRRVLGLMAHSHAHNTRLTAYKVPRFGAERQLIYQEFNWAEANFFYYDSLTQNPKTNLEQRLSGASSGELILEPGDAVEWECEIHNTSSSALPFGNAAFAAEMCNIFGATTPPAGGDVNWRCLGGDL